MPEVKNPYPLCERDNFPMVRIGGQLQCVFEYLNRCIGGQKIVDVVRHGRTTYFVFEDGHELPLLCACCGEPLEAGSIGRERRAIRGRRLESMLVNPLWRGDDLYLEFSLGLSKKGILSRRLREPVAPEVAARMRHPDGCPYAKKASSRRRGRKKRKRKGAAGL